MFTYLIGSDLSEVGKSGSFYRIMKKNYFFLKCDFRIMTLYRYITHIYLAIAVVAISIRETEMLTHCNKKWV